MVSAFETRMRGTAQRLVAKYGRTVSIAPPGTSYTPSTGQGDSPATSHHYPSNFQMLGPMQASAGQFAEPGGGFGDCEITQFGDKWGFWCTTYNPSMGGAGLAYIEKPYDPDNITQNWSPSVLSGGHLTLFVPPIEGSTCEERVDTATVIYHPILQKYLVYYSAVPGTRTMAPGNSGYIFSQQVASSDLAPSPSTVWTRHATQVVQASPFPAYDAGFIFEAGLEGNNWIGGDSDGSVIWEPSDQRLVLFFEARTWPGYTSPGVGTGPFRWSLGRAVETGGDGLTFAKDAQDVFCPREDISETQWAGGFGGSHRFHVIRDPIDGVYHCFFAGGNQADDDDEGIGHALSTDKGLTWTPNPNNPLWTISTLRNATGSTSGQLGWIGAPFAFIDANTNVLYLGVGCAAPGTVSYGNSTIYVSSVSRGANVFVPAKMVQETIETRYYDLGLAITGDTAGIFDAVDVPFVPTTGMYVVTEGLTWVAVHVEAFASGEQDAAYRVILRRA